MTIHIDGSPIEVWTKRDLLEALAPLNEDLDLTVWLEGNGPVASVEKFGAPISGGYSRMAILITGHHKGKYRED